MGLVVNMKSVVPPLAEPRLRAFHTEFFEELHQAVDQPAAAADHVQAAFVLVLLENVVDLVLQFRHWTPPWWTVSTIARVGAG